MFSSSMRFVRRSALVMMATAIAAALMVAPASASQFFGVASPSTNIPIPTTGTGPGPAASSTVTVSGQGNLTTLSVQVVLSHTAPDNLDLLLVGPAGQQVVLMSDACGGPANPLWTTQLIFSDSATAGLSNTGPCASGTFKPTNVGAGDTWTGAPALSLSPDLATAFPAGTDPNGTWTLYVQDDAPVDTGTLVTWAVIGTTDDSTISTGAAAPAKPYPASVNATPLPTGVISDVNVALGGLTHTFPADLDVLVVSPEGTAVLLASDTCGGTDVANRTWTFDDEASADLPAASNATCDSNLTVRPTNVNAGDTFPAPAPAPPYATSLSAFDGQTGNGAWQAYVVDDSPNDGGSIKNIAITVTSAASDVVIPSLGDANPNPSVRTIDLGRPLTDVNVKLNGLSHTYPDDLDMLLVGPTGASTVLTSDACGSGDLQRVTWTIDDEAPGGLPDSSACPTGSYQPSNFAAGGGDVDTFGGEAPAGPYGATLAAFDGTNPDGDWKLYVNDDSGGDVGYIQTGWSPEIQTRDGGPVTLGAATVNAPAGTPLTLTLTRGVLPPGLLAGSVKVDTAAGTATAGADFTALSQVVSFAAGETTKTIAVPIAANTAGEPAESFAVRLSDPQRDAALGATTQTTVTIPAAPATAPTTKPVAFTAANAITLPSNKACLKPRTTFRITPRKIKGTTISKITVTYGKTLLATRKGKTVGKAFTLKNLPRKAFTITVKIRAKNGKTVTLKRRYKPCKR